MKRDRLLVAIVSIGVGFAAGYAWHAIQCLQWRQRASSSTKPQLILL